MSVDAELDAWRKEWQSEAPRAAIKRGGLRVFSLGGPARPVSEFLELSIHRCRTRIAAVKFAAVLYFLGLACCLGRASDLVFQHSSIWFVGLLFAGFGVWYYCEKRAELAYLLKLRSDRMECAPMSVRRFTRRRKFPKIL